MFSRIGLFRVENMHQNDCILPKTGRAIEKVEEKVSTMFWMKDDAL